MGCDIHLHYEKRLAKGWESIDVPCDRPYGCPLNNRNYGMFGLLAGVRNYSGVTPLAEPRGVPDDVSEGVRASYEFWDCDGHSHSWLSLAEIETIDPDASMENRRVTRQLGPNHWDGGCTCAPGEGKIETWREFLGAAFFERVAELRAAGVERVVFWFDN